MLHCQVKWPQAVVIALLLCSGCAMSPDRRLVTLDDEIQALRARSQETSVLRELAFADQLRRDASAEIRAQRDRFWASRTYRRVERLLDDAEVHLTTARSANKLARLRTEQETRDGVSIARRELARVAALLDAFPVGRDTLDDRTRMRRDLVALRTALARARQAATEGDPETAAAVVAGVIHETRLVAAFVARAADHVSSEFELVNLDEYAPSLPSASRPRAASTRSQRSSATERMSTLRGATSVRVPPR